MAPIWRAFEVHGMFSSCVSSCTAGRGALEDDFEQCSVQNAVFFVVDRIWLWGLITRLLVIGYVLQSCVGHLLNVLHETED